MKRTVCFLALTLLVPAEQMSAQETKPRVAVFHPCFSGAEVEASKSVAVRELIGSALAAKKYTVVDYSLLDEMMKEQAFPLSDMEDGGQAAEIAGLAGADNAVIAAVTPANGGDRLSIKTIDVQTAAVVLQKDKIVNAGELLNNVEWVTMEMLDSDPIPASAGQQEAPAGGEAPEASNSSQASATPVPANGRSIVLKFDGVSHDRNPSAKIFFDNVPAGEGTFNGGFHVRVADTGGKTHRVRIEWSDFVDDKTFSINTDKRKEFTFEYARGGFGYELRIKN